MTTTELDFKPAAQAASGLTIVWAQARYEFSLLMRNGEQILLTLVIPLFILVGLTMLPFIKGGEYARVSVVVPGIVALAVMSTAFTAQAISVGFDRRYGVLKLFGATPLTRVQLLTARTIAILVVEALQVVLILIVAYALGWRQFGFPLTTALMIIMGTAAFSALAIALAGVLRAQATLAVANAIYFVLVVGGGILLPQSQMPSWLASFTELLPSGALGSGLRESMLGESSFPIFPIVVLAVWCAIGVGIAARTFKWE